MRDGGRISAAIEILADLETRRRPVQDALKDWGLTHRFAGSRDRSAIGNLVYDVLRRRASLGAIMGNDDPRALVFAAYALQWGKGLDGLAAAADPADRHAPAPPTPAEAAALTAATLPDDADIATRADLPGWLVPSLARVFGDRLETEGRALAARADVDLRANTLKADRDAVLADLAGAGAIAATWSPVGVRVPVGPGDEKAPHLVSELSFKRGWFEVQDEGSQLAALVAAEALGPAAAGSVVIDLCAGGGGKSLALAAALGDAGRILAYDNDKRRFGDILDRIARSGASGIEVLDPGRGDPLAPLAGSADLVVVDAPCTGTGTWRRRPDAKWRLAPGALEMRREQQRGVLGAAAQLVRPGGTICYITCSVLPEENEDQVAAFLAARRDFRLEDTAAALGRVAARPLPETTRVPLGAGTAARLTPHATGTDGFFIARLRRAD
ncbi:RsmB/NOP family class I SAM-dependent RNA methyltransferase [Methylobrevis albus]|uniref:RsmB/NOP family class I SAM-dependent RNA methyltransferase n=1 Tax=Methylobrevis albus TaxID=2793297 RepID=A0A931I4E4_9HYPH|nr:RsmB/NOP family class I SAM-dependent RNA methyltransferase [Methylobrevis albus]MBH0239015.1 RsmB/NOP family class I SAM-dependent RNA methyltransferase [Methylobrevis albus]